MEHTEASTVLHQVIVVAMSLLGFCHVDHSSLRSDYALCVCCGCVCLSGETVLYGNTIYSPTAAVQECGESLQAWQAKGNDPGTTANVLPADETILDWFVLTQGVTAVSLCDLERVD